MKRTILLVYNSLIAFANADAKFVLDNKQAMTFSLKNPIEGKKIGYNNVSGKWEAFHLKTMRNPFPGNKAALIIVGSDRRGTATSFFEISNQIGVSP